MSVSRDEAIPGRLTRQGYTFRAATHEARPATRVGEGERLDTLDGMRGVAALLVVFYHLFARWAQPEHSETLYPHGNILEVAPFVAYLGQVGVLLFFLISGFLMLMTLERSTGLFDFAGRRIARLWPAMLICATMSTLILNLTPVAAHYGMPDWRVQPLEYVASIFFVNPNLVAQAMGQPPADYVEGVYWTLFAEVRFYALIAVVFLLTRGAQAFLWAWVAVQAVSTAVEFTMVSGVDFGPAQTVLWLAVQPRYLGWFSLGICGYLMWRDRVTLPVYLIAIFGLVAIAAGEIVSIGPGGIALAEGGARLAVVYLAVSAPFLLFLWRSPILAAFRWKPVIAVGLASYPLYLFHERPGMAGLMLTDGLGLPPLFGVLLVVTALIAVALVVHHAVEMPGKRGLTRVFKPGAQWIETRLPWLRFPPPRR